MAQLAGCSQTTVSFVMNNRTDIAISDETREKVLRAAEQLNYVPNQFAKGLRTNRSNLIGLIVPSMDNPYFSSITRRIEEYATGKGYSVITCNSYRQPAREREQHNLLLEKSVDGIIYTFTPRFSENIKALSRKTELVVFGERDDSLSLPQVCYDGFAAGRAMGEYLIGLGHRKIGYLSTPFSGSFLSRQNRLDGLRSAMAAHGLPQEDIVVKIDIPDSTSTDTPAEFQTGYRACRELLAECAEVTAMVGMNDMIALGAMDQILTHTGLRIPADISLCGFDDIYLGNLYHPKLTTMNHNLSHATKLTVDTLLALIDGRANEVPPMQCHESRLVVRQSTGPARDQADL